MARIVTADIEVAGCAMRVGDRVLLDFPAATVTLRCSPTRTPWSSTARSTVTPRSVGASTAASVPTWPA
jgi:hypothetical protein